MFFVKPQPHCEIIFQNPLEFILFSEESRMICYCELTNDHADSFIFCFLSACINAHLEYVSIQSQKPLLFHPLLIQLSYQRCSFLLDEWGETQEPYVNFKDPFYCVGGRPR